jgi:CheY-like chemotaxis protein
MRSDWTLGAMKKILITRDIHALLNQESTFLNRSDLRVFVGATSDELLQIHRSERVDVIITSRGLPGMPCERFCSLIREDAGLRTVSIIMTCADDPDAIRESGRCRANSILLEPLHSVLVAAKAEQLLNIAARETLRVLLNADVLGESGDSSFYGRTVNVSASGLFIETGRRLPAETRLSCRFYLPAAAGQVRVMGKIVRIIEPAARNDVYQYGLMFTEIAPEVRKQLADYVDEMSRRPRA